MKEDMTMSNTSDQWTVLARTAAGTERHDFASFEEAAAAQTGLLRRDEVLEVEMLEPAEARRRVPLTAGEAIARGELLYSQLHERYVRFDRWEGGLAVVTDRNTLRELSDWVYASQLRRA
jgi:hypothetical protein